MKAEDIKRGGGKVGFSDKMLLLKDLTERIMMHTNIKDPEKAQEIARKWMRG